MGKKNFVYDPVLHILDVFEKLIDIKWETATCPEECESWSDWEEDYDRLLYALINTLRSYRKEDIENEEEEE